MIYLEYTVTDAPVRSRAELEADLRDALRLIQDLMDGAHELIGVEVWGSRYQYGKDCEAYASTKRKAYALLAKYEVVER